MKKISIITPCFNEEEGLIDCTKKITDLFSNELKKYDYEHIICDNNSNEKTIRILREISLTNNKIKVILNAKNYGSVKSTFNGIKNSSGDAVLLFFPVDMQDPPEKIPELIKKWENGFDFVIGCREQREELIIMKSIRKFFYSITNNFRISYSNIRIFIQNFYRKFNDYIFQKFYKFSLVFIKFTKWSSINSDNF